MNQQMINNPFNPAAATSGFDEVQISLASPEKILSWSFGEIKKPETINYRTFKPERDGLFCARIFGPIKDYECVCGKYKKRKYNGVVCEKCGVEITIQRVRRERMGHITLAAPVAHIWFLKSLPSRIGLILDLTLRDLERILYFEQYVVIDPALTELSAGQLMNEDEYYEAQDEYGESGFHAGIGAEAIREMLSNVNLETEADHLREDLAEATSELKIAKIIKRLKVIEAFIESGNRPEWMVMTTLPVIPPELRPLVPLDGGRFAASDLNDLYRRVINRNNRLKRLMELRAPDIIVRNEKRMLQESVDALFDNGRRGRIITGTNKRPLKSLSDMLKGKQGRFRQNLLGKRVDFSGRSVIVTGPELKLHQCGLPKQMALELFKPFIFSRLEARGLSSTVKQSKKFVEKERSEVWDILDDVIREHPILLNRAPTLHRLGIQAFEPILIEGKAIQLHPLVCAAFNADFDGDQMAVHVPLSLESQLEARVLMLSSNNVLSPANGKPIVVPSQDMILGIYYLSLARKGMPGEGMIFASPKEVDHALDNAIVHLHSNIVCRMEVVDEQGNTVYERFDTTPGRVKLGCLLPPNNKAPFSLVNRLLRKKEVGEVIDTVYRYCGKKESVIFCDKIMSLGFKESCKAGISFGKDDIVVPEKKEILVNATRELVKSFEQQYMDGLISQGEKYNKVVDAWTTANEEVTEAMMTSISTAKFDKDDVEQEPNSVYMMAHSGARGSTTQMRQLGGMRGLMAKPNGDIIETPIISNFKEGLSVLEYFNSTHGARKGLSDTALKTANSGYLTRRLVDVAQDCIVRQDDCGTPLSITARAAIKDGIIISTLSERCLGRVVAEDVLHPATGEIMATKGQMLDERMSDEIEKSGLVSLLIRSPLTCEAEEGVCAQCYGRDLARGEKANIGEAVGIIAAQSIGEPGTQLTMRTFHIGGVAEGSQQSFQDSSQNGIIEIRNANILKTRTGEFYVMARNVVVAIMDENKQELVTHKVDYGTKLLVKTGDKVARGDKLFEWDPYTLPIIAQQSGIARFHDLVAGVSLRHVTDYETGITQRIVSDWRSMPSKSDLKPEVSVVDKKTGEDVLLENGNPDRHAMSVDAILSVEDGQEIIAGDILARIPRASTKTKDITGGLPRVAELFEARRPKNHAIIAEMDGYVSFGKDFKNKRRIQITASDDETNVRHYMVPKGKHIPVREGDFIQKGEYIMDGNPAPHDILNIMGIEALAEYMIEEVQEVYRLQGVKINDKHIEVIVRQMLQKWEISESGGTTLLKGEQVDKAELEEINALALKKELEPAVGAPILLGITKASLQTRSFISAASFQETTRILTEAAIKGKKDRLIGLKENVIVGRLIPAGTGGAIQKIRAIAAERDAVILEDKRKEEEARLALNAPTDLDGDKDPFDEAAMFERLQADVPEDMSDDTTGSTADAMEVMDTTSDDADDANLVADDTPSDTPAPSEESDIVT